VGLGWVHSPPCLLLRVLVVQAARQHADRIGRKGTVTGTLHLAGGPAPGTIKPAAGEVYVFTSASLTGTPTAKATTAPDGSFSLALSPGMYYLAATSPSFTIDPPPAAPPCHGNTPAVVSPGSTSKVDVVCEMK